MYVYMYNYFYNMLSHMRSSTYASFIQFITPCCRNPKKISYECRDYESVDEKSLSEAVSRKTTKK